MHELWTGPRSAWRDDNRPLPDIRPRHPDNSGRPCEGGEASGAVIFQHWLSNEIVTSQKKEHKAWVAQCYPRPIHRPVTGGLTNQDLEVVLNSKATWAKAYSNARRLVDPLEPRWDEQIVRRTLSKWQASEIEEEQGDSDHFNSFD